MIALENSLSTPYEQSAFTSSPVIGKRTGTRVVVYRRGTQSIPTHGGRWLQLLGGPAVGRSDESMGRDERHQSVRLLIFVKTGSNNVWDQYVTHVPRRKCDLRPLTFPSS